MEEEEEEVRTRDLYKSSVLQTFLAVSSYSKTLFFSVLGMDNFGGMNNMDRFGSSGMGRMNGKETL